MIDIGNGKYYAQLNNGIANVSISNLDVGSHDVFVRYVLGSEMKNATATIQVKDKFNPNMNVSVNLANVNVGLPSDATGNVTVICDGHVVADVKATNNVCVETLNILAAGMHIIEVNYSGDDKYSSASKKDFVVNKINTKIDVNSKITMLASDVSAGESSGTITFKLTDENNNILSNKIVQIALNGEIYPVETNDEGYGKLKVSLESGNVYTCALSFGGDEKYSATPLTITKLAINKKKTTISASSKTFKVKSTKMVSATLKTVKNVVNGKTYLKKGKKLTLTVNGKTYSAKTNAKGIAKFTVKLTKKGKYSAKIKFAGDKTYKSSSKSIKITIK